MSHYKPKGIQTPQGRYADHITKPFQPKKGTPFPKPKRKRK
jgi:hypothetical protein